MLAACVLPIVACHEPASGLCEFASMKVIPLGAGELCDVTSTGLVLHLDDSSDEVVLERLSKAGMLDELARLPAGHPRWCGRAAEDPVAGTLWVVVPAESSDSPDWLYELDGAGHLRKSEALTVGDAAMHVSSLLVRDGDLFLGGQVVASVPDDLEDVQAVLERRDGDGQILWRQLGYQGLHPEVSLSELPLVGLYDLVSHGSGLAFLSGRSWSVAMFAVSAFDGQATWTEYVTPHNFEGPHPQLGSDGEHRIYLAEERQPLFRDVANRLGLIRHARTIVTAYADDGWTQWRSEIEWPDFDNIRVSEPVAVQGSVYNVVWGGDLDYFHGERHVALARFDSTGAVDCRSSLDHLGLWSGGSLTLADGETLVLGATIPLAEKVDWNDPPTEPVIVLLEPVVESIP